MLADYQTIVDDMVRDIGERVGTAARDRAIGLAVLQYGTDMPREVTSDLAAAGTAPRYLPLPEGWDEASTALALEHPVGQWPQVHLLRPDWGELRTPAGLVIGLPGWIAEGAACRLTWTRPHVLSADEDTIPARHREAVAQYAAAVLLDQQASLSSGDQDATIKADSVDHGSTSRNFADRARRARDRYHELLGIDPKRQAPASIVVAPPLESTSGRWMFFSRPRRW